MINNETAISILHSLSDFANESDGKDAIFLDKEHALALDLGASAIKTLDDMDDIMQKILTLSTEDIDTLMSFLKTHSVSEIVTILDYLNSKCHLNSLYGKTVYTDTDSIKSDVSRETSESENK